MRIVAGIAAMVAIVVILWVMSLLVEADSFTRSEWGVEHQVQFGEAWRAQWRIAMEDIASTLKAVLDRFGLANG